MDLSREIESYVSTQDLNNYFKRFFFALYCLFYTVYTANGQDVVRIVPCSDNSGQKSSDSLKTFFGNDGFSIIREDSVVMQSGFELPIIVFLRAGGLYKFAFIGSGQARFIELRVYDYDEKQVVYQKRNVYSEGRLILFDFIPRFSEYYMFKPVQEFKKVKEQCGLFLLFKKARESG